MTIKNNLFTIQEKIHNITSKNINIIAVTKYASLDQMQAVIKAGLINLGESKVQDLIKKKEYFNNPKLTWHFIGHLQSNKVKKAVQYADFIQSVDSLKLLECINDLCWTLVHNVDANVCINQIFHQVPLFLVASPVDFVQS